jgi:hypothetical protein
MKSSLLFAAACLAIAPFKLSAATTHYVDAGGTNSVLPYTNWVTAATNIQDAVDAAENGDPVLVNDGIYQDGYRIIEQHETNRVVVTKPLTIQSLNGPLATIINGSGIYRCVFLTNGAFLNGFTLANGKAGWIDVQRVAANGGGV